MYLGFLCVCGNWTLYRYIIPLLTLDNFPCFDVTSVLKRMLVSAFFWLVLTYLYSTLDFLLVKAMFFCIIIIILFFTVSLLVTYLRYRSVQMSTQSFTADLSVPLYLKWLSHKQRIAGSFFKTHYDSVFKLGCLDYSNSKWLLMSLDSSLPCL